MQSFIALISKVPRWSLILAALMIWSPRGVLAQAEVQAWGNVTGLRVEGQLMPFETSFRVVNEEWTRISRTAREAQRPRYERRGDLQVVRTRLDSVFFSATYENVEVGALRMTVDVVSRADTAVAGVYLSVALPNAAYADATVELIGAEDLTGGPIPDILRGVARGVRVVSPARTFRIEADGPTPIVVRTGENSGDRAQLYLALATGPLADGEQASASFTVQVEGPVDRRPVTLSLDTTRPGRRFDGLGGNFRLQNPRTDPQVIDYSLEHLRVAWARVDAPWMLWHPDEEMDPIATADAGRLHPRVAASMEMAQRVHAMGIPVMLAVWFPPDWAVEGERHSGRGTDGRFGNALDRDKLDTAYASIADYVVYLRDRYGVEVEMFSFNESDLGIDVRQSPEEHAQMIRRLGALFRERGLKTKLLLGDTADITGHSFIDVAMEDASTHPYIGALSFHSWRGWSTENLLAWAAAAERMNLPLVVGEGSIDAGAWRYPAIFREETYARQEIDLYTRIMALCQPQTILQWQLTADYSTLAGGGIFGNDDEPLHPTQRFWNLKQLASTPEGLAYLPIAADRPEVTVAALGDGGRGRYAVHLVNNGATREVTLRGLPDGSGPFRIFVTDEERSMEEGRPLSVIDGRARFTAPATSYISLMN